MVTVTEPVPAAWVNWDTTLPETVGLLPLATVLEMIDSAFLFRLGGGTLCLGYGFGGLDHVASGIVFHGRLDSASVWLRFHQGLGLASVRLRFHQGLGFASSTVYIIQCHARRTSNRYILLKMPDYPPNAQLHIDISQNVV